MGELIKVDFDNQTVSARDLHEKLLNAKNFSDFFVIVCKEKVVMDATENKVLLKELGNPIYLMKYGSEPIVYLKDCILTEMVLPCASLEARKFDEKRMQEEIANNFSKIFPQYTFVSTEKRIDGIGRVDVFALYGERPVIIEIKTGSKNPNGQLLAYGSKFTDPILIGITEKPISDESKIKNIQYLIFDDLKKNTKEWII